jgi:glycosyltransferase involved in cell wall biosynthesis
VLRAIARVFPEAPIFTLFHFPGSVDREIEAHTIYTTWLRHLPKLKTHYRYYLPLFPLALRSLEVRQYPLVVSTSHCVVKSVRKGPQAFHLCYCHTPMRYAWDQEEAYFGSLRGPVRWVQRLILAALRRWDRATAHRVDLFLANSRFVAERIRRHYGRTSELLPPPVNTEFFRPAPESRPRTHLLVVAALSPYKRIDRAMEAALRLGLRLVIVGDGPERRRLEALSGPGIEFAGRVSAESLRDLYRSAIAYVQPGVEDFGIAAVEALACGTPVVALGQGGILDIVEDGKHGLLVPDSEPGAFEVAIDRATKMEWNLAALRQRAEAFSAGRFDREFRNVLRRVFPPAEGWLR